VLATPPEKAYASMQDPVVLARCMPGCEALEKIGDNEYKMNIAFASLSSAFEGKIKIIDENHSLSCKLLVEGLLRLAPHREGTEVSYEGDVQVRGTMAAVGRRLIDDTAR
jgi:carbon monoxide dehydrogenase subunit G